MSTAYLDTDFISIFIESSMGNGWHGSKVQGSLSLHPQALTVAFTTSSSTNHIQNTDDLPVYPQAATFMAARDVNIHTRQHLR